MAYHRHHGVDTRIVRIFNTYGPRMRPGDGRVVSNFIVQALRGDPLTMYGDGSQTRSFCYVDDEVDGIYRLFHSDRHERRRILGTRLNSPFANSRTSSSRKRRAHRPWMSFPCRVTTRRSGSRISQSPGACSVGSRMSHCVRESCAPFLSSAENWEKGDARARTI